MMFIITAVAVIVGFVQFVKRSWVENDMSTKVRNATVTVLSFVNNISGVTLEALSTDSPKAV
jgi:preprotein translocase subunit Sec63